MNEFRHKKELGQHFLKDANIAAKIAALGEIREADKIWEIGPGNGILTREILRYTNKVTAFEIDETLYERIEKEFGEKLELVKKDVLQVDWQKRMSSGKVKIIANIPYQITSPLLMKMAAFQENLERVVLMIQQEVAERMRAKPGTKEYSFLSIKTQFYFNIKYEFTVKPHVFIPPPKVQSAVISLVPCEDVFPLADPGYFWQMVDASLRSRRKTLRNNLKYLISVQQIAMLEKDFDLTRRAETFSIPEFIALYQCITAIS